MINFGNTRINIVQGDITKIKADAIVNSANSSLSPGSGVSGAIHLAAGPELTLECKEIIKKRGKELAIGEALLTSAYKLEKRGVQMIIHTVTPKAYCDMMSKLGDCYENSLKLAKEEGCKSIAFPALATGAHGLDMEKSARYTKRMLEINNRSIEEIILVLSNKEDKEIYKKILEGRDMMDSAGFCPACLSPISDLLSTNIDGFFCSEKCAENFSWFSKKNQKKVKDIISIGLLKQKNREKEDITKK